MWNIRLWSLLFNIVPNPADPQYLRERFSYRHTWTMVMVELFWILLPLKWTFFSHSFSVHAVGDCGTHFRLTYVLQNPFLYLRNVFKNIIYVHTLQWLSFIYMNFIIFGTYLCSLFLVLIYISSRGTTGSEKSVLSSSELLRPTQIRTFGLLSATRFSDFRLRGSGL